MNSWGLADKLQATPKRLTKKQREALAKGVKYGNPNNGRGGTSVNGKEA